MSRRVFPSGPLALLALAFASLFTFPRLVHADDPSVVGQWSAVMSWPIVSIHTSLLPTRKVLVWPRNGENVYVTNAPVWDPAANSFTAVPLNTANLFCSGHTPLSDGR